MKLIDEKYGDLTVYEKFVKFHNDVLKSQNVKLIKNNTGSWFKLQYFLEHYQEKVSSRDVYEYVKSKIKNVNGSDISIRSLWRDYGYYVVSMKSGGYTPSMEKLNQSEYCLYDITQAKPGFSLEHRSITLPKDDWEEILKEYDYKCACCGVRIGEIHPTGQVIIENMDQGHLDPNKPLSKDNCIPQCSFCNRTNQNNVIFSPSGAVLALNNTKIFDNSELSVKIDCIKKFIKDYPDEFRKIIEGL